MPADKDPRDPEAQPVAATPAGPASPSPKGVILCMILTIMVVVSVTEFFEMHFPSSEPAEAVVHILALSGVLGPLFYFFWFRPLSRQMTLVRSCELQVRSLSHRLIEASEAERQKLARDLHDEFGQKLTLLQIQLEALEQALSKGEIPPPGSCRPLKEIVSDLTNDLRNVLSDLRPACLDELGLVAALEGLCAEIGRKETNLRVGFRSAGISSPLHPEVQIALFRSCQEALTNVIRHARANQVEVCLTRCHPSVILLIEDDGIGFETRPAPAIGKFSEQYGLIGMRERVAAVGGTLRIVNQPEGGARIRIEVPESLLSGDQTR
jgi:signal transduction histidine kinase